MKRDTVPARPLAGARVDGGNDGQSEPRQEETLLARKGRMQNLSAGTEYSLTEFKCRADNSESVRAHASKRCRGKGAKQPKRPCGHAAMQQGHVRQFKAPNQIYHTLRDSATF